MRLSTLVLIAGVVATVVLCGIHASMLLSGSGGDPSIALLAPALWAYSALGWVILRHRPDHRIGWLLLAAAPLVDTVFFGFTAGAIGGLPEPVVAVAAWLAVVLFAPAILVAVPAFGLLFPDGHLPGPRWRGPATMVCGAALTASAMIGLAPGTLDASLPTNPFGLPFLPEELRALGSFLAPVSLVLAGVLAVASVAVRVRRSRAVEREQMKWMLAAITIVVVLVVPTIAGSPPLWLNLASSLSLVLIPGAAAVAILRYRLYDIDRIISRTIAWTVVSGILLAGFALGIVALQALFAGVTQGQTLAVAATTLVAFGAAQPLLRWVQARVDRRFNRARYDAQRTVDAFGERLRDVVAMESVASDLQSTIDVAVRPATQSLWLRGRFTDPRALQAAP